jgi:hypothetical protein
MPHFQFVMPMDLVTGIFGWAVVDLICHPEALERTWIICRVGIAGILQQADVMFRLLVIIKWYHG